MNAVANGSSGSIGAGVLLAISALRDPGAVVGPDGVVRDVNRAWELLSRRPDAPPVLTATPHTSLPNRCRTAQLSGFAQGESIAAAIEDVLHGIRPEYDVELEWRLGNESHWYLLNVLPLGEPQYGALVLHRDITAQKLAQASLAEAWDFYLRLFDEFPALIWRSDPGGEITWFNRTFLEFTGRTTEQLRGKGWLELMHPADREGYHLIAHRAKEAHRAYQLELRLRRRDGEYRWVVASGRPYQDLEGGFAGYVCAANDITEVRRAEADAVDARAAERAADNREKRAQADLMDQELGRLETFRSGQLGLGPLHEASPEAFAQLARRYGDLLDLALERQIYKDVTAVPSTGLKDLAQRLGLLHAGPRDVVELHTRVLQERTKDPLGPKRQAYLSEGRVLALELMGDLVAWYRARAAPVLPGSSTEQG